MAQQVKAVANVPAKLSLVLRKQDRTHSTKLPSYSHTNAHTYIHTHRHKCKNIFTLHVNLTLNQDC